MTTVRISVQAPEGDVTVEVDRETITTRYLGVVPEDITPSVLEVLDVAVARVRGAYAVDEETDRG